MDNDENTEVLSKTASAEQAGTEAGESAPRTEEEEKKEKNLIRQINEVITLLCLVIYFIVSFITFAWHITWIIFIISGLLCQAVKLIFMLKGEEKGEE